MINIYDLSNAALNNLGNLGPEGKTRVVSFIRPDTSRAFLIPAANVQYVAATDLWISAEATSTGANGIIYLYSGVLNTGYELTCSFSGTIGQKIDGTAFVPKGWGYNLIAHEAVFDMSLCIAYPCVGSLVYQGDKK